MLEKFLDYIEIRTKITSTFAFLMTVAYLLYQEQQIQWGLTLLFFAAMLTFDLTTTAINNYIDTKNNHQKLQFKRRTALMIIYVLFLIGAGLGLYLAYLTDVVVLLAGALCFLCGVFYTYGPVPISRMPLGEVLSGMFYGLLIPFIILYINMPAGTYLTLVLSWETVNLSMKVMPILELILFSVIPFCATANIMLANNICDLEKDIAVKRHTLPYYIGRKAIDLFAGLYYLCYLVVIIMVAVRMISPICLLSLLTILPVQKNIKTFYKKQEKASTFMMAIKNYLLIMGSVTLVIFVSAAIH